MSEEGCSREKFSTWAMMADSVGSTFQIDDESTKKAISEDCACHGIHVLQITVCRLNPPERPWRSHQGLKCRCPRDILTGEAFVSELTECLLTSCWYGPRPLFFEIRPSLQNSLHNRRCNMYLYISLNAYVSIKCHSFCETEVTPDIFASNCVHAAV